MGIVVGITAEDIALGIRDHCTRCPGARAINRALGSVFPGREVRSYVTTHACYVDILNHDGTLDRCIGFECPEELAEFILAYDHHQPVGSIAFDLALSV